MSNEAVLASAETAINDPGVDEFCYIVAGIVRRLIARHTGERTLAETPDRNSAPVVPPTGSSEPNMAIPGEPSADCGQGEPW